MRSGKLRHRITIQKQDQTQDQTTGEILYSWVDVATVWASVEPLSAREFIQSQAVQSEVATRIVIRHRDDVRSDMRIVHRGRLYNIHGVLSDAKSGLEYLTLPCSEGVGDGS